MNEPTAAYIRVSTQEQKLHGYSLDAQRDKLKRYAESHNLEIVGWYEDEGISGRKEVRKRPALQRMMQDAEKGAFRRIIFIKLDRYFRSVGEYYACQKILDAHGITWSATEEDYDLTTATGRLLVSQKLAIAEYEADNTSERIKLVNEYKVRSGQPICGRKALHVGFMVGKTPEGKRIVHDPEKEHIAKDIIATFQRKQSLYGTVMHINLKYGMALQNVNLKSFLRDTKLYGSYRGNDSYCEPYITKEEFDKIQAVLRNNVKHAPSRKVYLFTGLLRCPLCGRRLTANSDNDRLYYRCRYGVFRSCAYSRVIPEKSIEGQLLGTLDARVRDYVSRCAVSQGESVLWDPAPVKNRMQRVNKMFLDGRIEEKEYDREYASLLQRQKEIEAHNENADRRDLSELEALLNSGWKEKYAALDREHKRSFWRGIISEVRLTENKQIKEVIFF